MPEKQDEKKELTIKQFLIQQYGWGPDKSLRDIFNKYGLMWILGDFYDYLKYDK